LGAVPVISFWQFLDADDRIIMWRITPNATNRHWNAARWSDFCHPVRSILAPGLDAIVLRNMHNVAPKLGGVGVAHAKHAPKAPDQD
jgi:hypothetical protein